MAILHHSASLSKVAKYGTLKSRMTFCHLRCYLHWSIVFCYLDVILAVTRMTPLIATPVGVALNTESFKSKNKQS